MQMNCIFFAALNIRVLFSKKLAKKKYFGEEGYQIQSGMLLQSTYSPDSYRMATCLFCRNTTKIYVMPYHSTCS